MGGRAVEADDIVGKRFGQLVVVEYIGKKENTSTHLYRCKCDCGKEKAIVRPSLVKGLSKSCGCRQGCKIPSLEDIVGQTYGKLTVVKSTRRAKWSKQMYWCKCECGTEKEVSRTSLLNGSTRSCGCSYADLIVDITNQRFGNLVALEIDREFVGCQGKKGMYWKCRCDCGIVKTIFGQDLRKGCTQSCGCQQYNYEARRKYTPFEASAASVFKVGYNDGDLTLKEFISLVQQDCFYCGLPPQSKTNSYNNRKKIAQEIIDGAEFRHSGLDRIDSNLPHNKDNIVPCCKQCNTAKLDYSLEDFKQWIVRVYKHFASKED